MKSTQASNESPERVLRLGLIGAGRWARNYIRTLSAIPSANLVRIARSRAIHDDLPPHNAEITTDWRRVASAPDLDAIIIATPPHTHAQMAIAAIEAGHPVLVEKPLTTDLDEAKQILAAAEQRRTSVMVEHTHLFNPAFRALKELCRESDGVKAMDASAGSWGVFRKDAPVLWDWGAHDVAMCLDVMHEMPVRVSAQLLEQRDRPEGMGQSYALELTFRGDVKAKIFISNLCEKKQRSFTCRLSAGALVFDDQSAHKLVRLSGDEKIVVAVEDALPLSVAVHEFLLGVRRKSSDLSQLRLGVEVTEILHHCQQALAQQT